jgi:hypothetical protein
MDSLNERILAVLRARRDEYVRLVEILIAEGPKSTTDTYGPAEAAQMIDGLISLLTEALVGEGTEVRSFFLQTLIPSMASQDGDPIGIVAGAVQHAILMVSDAVQHVADDDREAATRWFANFFGGYVADIAVIVTKPPAP